MGRREGCSGGSDDFAVRRLLLLEGWNLLVFVQGRGRGDSLTRIEERGRSSERKKQHKLAASSSQARVAPKPRSRSFQSSLVHDPPHYKLECVGKLFQRVRFVDPARHP